MKWIDIEERLPPQDVDVIVSTLQEIKGRPFRHVMMASRFGDGWVNSNDGALIKFKGERVTHWMVLPDTPDKVVSE